MSSMESEQFFLKWNNFESNLASGFADLLQKEAMVDVTLAAEGKIVQAHKIILSICSSYFRNMFQVNPCQHPIVVLKDVRYQELTDMLDFMYKGEANVRQEDLPSFLKLAETLKVKGLAGNQGELDENTIKRNSESQISIPSVIKDSIREEPSCDFLDKSRKKSKRCSSPLVYTEPKHLYNSPNIKVEMEECDNNLVSNSLNNCSQYAVMKEERLSDNSIDSYGDNNFVQEGLEVEKIAGPSNVDENSDSTPQEFIFRFNPKRVPIWDFYIVNYEYGMAVCKVCRKIIKTRRRDGTRNVLSHMRNLHPAQYVLALQFKEQWKSMKQKQCLDFYKKKLTRLTRVNRLGSPLSSVNSKALRETRSYSFLDSCFGGYLLVLDGYSYRKRSTSVKKSYWFCCNAKCPAKGILLADGEFRLTHSEHNHKPEFEKIRRKEILTKLKKLSLQLNVSGQDLLEALNIKDDIKKHLRFIRTCRRRNKTQNRQTPLYVGLNYKRLPSRISSKEMLFYSGYFFRQDSINPQNEKCKYWRCRIKNCKARAKTDDIGNLTILKPLHNHSLEESEELLPGCSKMLKLVSPTFEKPFREAVVNHHGKKELENITWKQKKDSERQKDGFTTGGESASVIEDRNSAFCSSATNSESFNFEKLMAETLVESYCVSHEFNQEIN